ncbi:MAG: hypothetical protein IJQ43_00580 [Oscillospiraceae bacterium]|nr:hypothetical protein [Oscillospiraceae bacterium]MBR0207372.1 hypothetical protein [Oscillospiraceae bacterium]
MQKDALEKTCYVGGAGAFGVFIRWLQTQVAFNDEGLPDPSVFNVLVPVAILAAGAVFFFFVKRWRERRYYLPSAFTKALRNDGLIYGALRWFLGALMCIGAIALFASCEADKNVGFYRVLAALGLLAGASFPFILREANEDEPRLKLVCALSAAPMLLFAFWLVTCYKINSINGIVWAYGVEVVACCFLLLAFFRVAGFAYSSADAWHSLFFCMFAAFLAIVCLADERYMGMQLMLLAAAGMLMLYNWIMISNLKRKKVDPNAAAAADAGGFEQLYVPGEKDE